MRLPFLSSPLITMVGLLLSLLFSSCSDKPDKDLVIFEALDESLINSNKSFAVANQYLFHSLEEKLIDPLTQYRASNWHPKGVRFQQLSNEIINYIENLKRDLKKEAGLNDDEKAFRKDDRNAVTSLFNTKGKGKELYERLRKYKKDMLNVDTQIRNVFSSIPVVITESFDSTEKRRQDFTHIFFYDTSPIAALAMLSKFQNNVWIMENKMLAYCNENCRFIDCGFYDAYSVIIGQNSNYVRAGEKIEITAGVGAFSRKSQPEVIINGRNVEINENGVAIYKRKASGKSGKHFIPIKIDFIDEYGKKQTIEKKVEYTVAEETQQ